MKTNNVFGVGVGLETHIKLRICMQYQGRHEIVLTKSVLASGQSRIHRDTFSPSLRILCTNTKWTDD